MPPAPPAPPAVEEPVIEPEPEPEPAPRARAKRQKTHQAKSTAEAPKPVSTLLAERKLIGAAQIAIRKSEYKRARSILSQHKSEFPTGILAPERDAAWAIALCLDDKEDKETKGLAAARSFLGTHKSSPLAQRVKSSCGL